MRFWQAGINDADKDRVFIIKPEVLQFNSSPLVHTFGRWHNAGFVAFYVERHFSTLPIVAGDVFAAMQTVSTVASVC